MPLSAFNTLRAAGRRCSEQDRRALELSLSPKLVKLCEQYKEVLAR